ncbi:hypothetical protein [uncultured Formosa sp.]|uniref:hypothetical protein n=1 Tax=uncultured Formosa sp. TaxID=255435 RepID=UPI002617AE2D|nr:hypothetical protein [uncultured Formosa sp.]
MNRILIIFFLSFSVLNSFASSPQVSDYLIYKNDTIPTYNLLVEQYLQTRKEDKGRLFDLSFRNSIEGTLGTSLNCWRGYQAIYEIKNDSLFVNAIIDCHALENKNQIPENYIRKLFGEKVQNNKVFIDWFSGNISFPTKRTDNKMISWDGVFERIFMYENIIEIENGTINKISEQQNYVDLKNGIDRLDRENIKNVLFNRIKNYKWTKKDKFDCSEHYTVTIGKNGKISNVVMTEYQTEELIEEYWDTKREYNYCVKSIQRALKGLQFDIIKRKGIPIESSVSLEIWFNEDGTIEN